MSENYKLTTWRSLIYAGPEFSLKLATYPLLTVLPAIYAQNTAVSLAMVGTVVGLMRILDAVTDPLVGHLSDRTQSKWGRRKPWMIAGSLLSAVAILFLYAPPKTANWTYLAFWMGVFYIAWTMIEIPYKSWGAEITRDYRERSRIVMIRSLVGTVGGIVFVLIPFLPIFATTEITSDVLRTASYVVFVALPLLTLLTVWLVPRGETIAAGRDTILAFLKSVGRNGPFKIYLMTTTLGFIGLGINATLLYIFISFHLGIPEKFPHLLIIETLASVIFMPVWLKISNRIGKHYAWAACFILPLLYYPLLFFVDPGPNAFWHYAPIGFLNGAAQAALFFIPTSILGDVSDYGTFRTGIDRAGKFFSTYLVAFKISFAIASFVAFNALALVGFELGTSNSPNAILGFKVIFIVLPILCYLAGLIFIIKYPLTERRQTIIRKHLARRSRKSGVS